MPVFFDAEIQRKIIYQCFGTGEEVTVNELANLVKETVGFTGKINFNDNKPDSTPQKLMDSSRIHNLGWKHKISLQDGLKMAYQHFLSEIKNG